MIAFPCPVCGQSDNDTSRCPACGHDNPYAETVVHASKPIAEAETILPAAPQDGNATLPPTPSPAEQSTPPPSTAPGEILPPALDTAPRVETQAEGNKEVGPLADVFAEPGRVFSRKWAFRA